MRQGTVVAGPVVIPPREYRLEFARSGGPGGQHVNKVSTRVDLVFNVHESTALTEEQRARVLSALAGRISAGGFLRLTADDSRSQWQNREAVLERFGELVAQALRPRKRRLATRSTKASRERRIVQKRRRSEIKKLRGGRSRNGSE